MLCCFVTLCTFKQKKADKNINQRSLKGFRAIATNINYHSLKTAFTAGKSEKKRGRAAVKESRESGTYLLQAFQPLWCNSSPLKGTSKR